MEKTTVLVTGESAGAIAASFWVADIAGRWPETRVIALGDGAACRRLRMRVITTCLTVRRDGRGDPEPVRSLEP